ncbi:MAG TPA: dehydrogenase, partial [Marinobacter sp.]|nr:dehydrogenase [Marinobacter sp.]
MTKRQVSGGEASSRVLEQLRGKKVLITGTTGFLGKVVLEKLIRAVPDIGGIYLLIRGNKR